MNSGFLAATLSNWKGVNMATATLTQPDVQPLHASMRFATIYSGALLGLPSDEADASATNSNHAAVSAEDGLGCARGALIAIGLEVGAAVVALCLYGIWRY